LVIHFWRLAMNCLSASRVSLRLLLASAMALPGAFAGAQTPPPLPEIQVTTAAIVDYEFDWGRDGVYCPSCNFGAGNARLTFTDQDKNLWVGNIDYYTGEFYPPDGHGVLVDTGGAFATDFGNGPEWMFSSNGSQIVYTKYVPGYPQSLQTVGVAIATMTNGAWSGNFMDNGLRRLSPLGTLNISDTAPRLNYTDDAGANVYWRVWDSPATEQWVPISRQAAGGSRRWVPGQPSIIFSSPAAPDSSGNIHPQVFLYDTDARTLEQLTFDPTNKWGGFMWQAPEFDNEYVFFTVVNRTSISVYRKLMSPEEELKWTLINSISAPATLPYVWSPEPFAHNGRSFIFMQVSSSSAANDMSVPTQIAMTGIDPAKQSFRMLTNDSTIRRVRMDPEYFITARGPFIYYNRYVPSTDTRKAINDGVWRVDTKLGPPAMQ
jgi:hypothetical protein